MIISTLPPSLSSFVFCGSEWLGKKTEIILIHNRKNVSHSFVSVSDGTQRNVYKFASPDSLAWRLSGLLARGSFLGTQNVKAISLMRMNCLSQRTNSYNKSQGLDLKSFLLALESSVYGGGRAAVVLQPSAEAEHAKDSHLPLALKFFYCDKNSRLTWPNFNSSQYFDFTNIKSLLYASMKSALLPSAIH